MKRRNFCKKALATSAFGVVPGSVDGRGVEPDGSPGGSGTVEVEESAADGLVSTRGHYDVTWYNAVRREWGVGPTEYELATAVPGLDGDAPEELVVFAHGWLLNGWTATKNLEALAETLAANGYDHPVVGYLWDADEVVAADDWYPSVEIARRNGKKLGAFLRDYREANPETTLRVVGHSLGVQVVLSTVARLDEWDRPAVVDAATLLGAAVEDEVVSTADDYGESIDRAVGSMDNFHSVNDGTIASGVAGAYWDQALGNVGAEGPTPGNYADHHVPQVTNHFDYFVEDSGCVDAVIESWRDHDDAALPARVERGYLEGTGDADEYAHSPRSGTDRVVVTTRGRDGLDVDCYLTLDGRRPSVDDHDRRSHGVESEERIVVEDPTGTLGVLVTAYEGSGSYELRIAEGST